MIGRGYKCNLVSESLQDRPTLEETGSLGWIQETYAMRITGIWNKQLSINTNCDDELDCEMETLSMLATLCLGGPTNFYFEVNRYPSTKVAKRT
jgi:hypothetical protein